MSIKLSIKKSFSEKTLKNYVFFTNEDFKINKLINDLKIPIKKVAIELNQEILDKKKLNKIKLKKNDKIEIVHFIGGG